MGCDYGVALELFKEDRWAPDDNTRAYWYEQDGELCYSMNDDVKDPDEWSGGGYSGDVRQRVDKGNYILVELSDGCGGSFQAIFSKDMELKDE